MKYEDLRLGDRASLVRNVTRELVADFAQVTGDYNPIHLDEEYAARSFFHRRVAHGFLAASLVSAVLGAALPGPGTIYLSQNLEFKRPAYLGDEIRAWVEVTEKVDKQRKARLRTWVENQNGQLVLDGSAWVLIR